MLKTQICVTRPQCVTVRVLIIISSNMFGFVVCLHVRSVELTYIPYFVISGPSFTNANISSLLITVETDKCLQFYWNYNYIIKHHLLRVFAGVGLNCCNWIIMHGMEKVKYFTYLCWFGLRAFSNLRNSWTFRLPFRHMHWLLRGIFFFLSSFFPNKTCCTCLVSPIYLWLLLCWYYHWNCVSL